MATESSLPPEAPPQIPGFEAPGFPGGLALNPTEQDINRLYPNAPEPDIPVPQYLSSVNPFVVAETVPGENYLNRNNYENMFAIVYNPDFASTPNVCVIGGIIVDNNEVFNVPSGTEPGELFVITPLRRAPLDADITWWLNVMPTRGDSKVSTTKDTSADFSIPLARLKRGRNGFIQQLHRGAVFIGGGGGSKFPFRVTIRSEGTGSARKTFAVIDKGRFKDTERKTVPIPQFSTEDKTEKQIVTTGDLPVQLEWEYDWPGKTITNVQLVVDDQPWDGKEIVTPITSDTGHGKSKCAIAIIESKSNPQGGFDATVKAQLVNTGLRAMWASGYVDGVSGDIGMYAEASTMNPDA